MKVLAAGPAQNGSPTARIFGTEANRVALMRIYDERLRDWPIPFETFFVGTRFGRTQILAAGDPSLPPLVMIHQMGVGSFVWGPIIGPLSQHYRVYALDTIGDIGRSVLADPRFYPKSGRDYSRWLLDVWIKLGIEKADIVAGSMGGWIAMNFAIYASRRVRSLVLLGPMGLPNWRTTLGVLLPFAWYMVRPTPAKLERIIQRSLGDGLEVNRQLRPWMLVLGQCKPRVGQPFPVSAGRLRRIKAKTLVILGGHDGLVGSPRAAAARARRNIPNCRVRVMPTAGHIMHVDEPEAVSQRIVEFLMEAAL